MVFDTRTVDTMKESLAHYFDISCEELVEFIKEAADNTQAKSRDLFNADIFTEELDAFLENIEVTEQIDGVMCFHFSRRINNTAPDRRSLRRSPGQDEVCRPFARSLRLSLPPLRGKQS